MKNERRCGEIRLKKPMNSEMGMDSRIPANVRKGNLMHVDQRVVKGDLMNDLLRNCVAYRGYDVKGDLMPLQGRAGMCCGPPLIWLRATFPCKASSWPGVRRRTQQEPFGLSLIPI